MNKMNISLIKIKPSTRKGKRFDAFIEQNNKQYKISFGDSTRESYPYHKDKKRKILYMKRHLRFLKKTFNKIEPPILSTCILWGYPDLNKSINAFKKQLKNIKKGIAFKSDIELYENIKRKMKNKNKGLWSARLSQQLSNEYKKQFINLYNKPYAYINFSFEPKNQLKKWTKEDWQYVDNKGSKRYLPKIIIEQLTEKQKQQISKNKILDDKSKWPKFLINKMRKNNII